MRTVLLDTGPIVAFLKADDSHHAWAVDAFSRFRPPLLTCEPVLSEAVFLLRRLANGPQRIFELARRGVLRLDFRLADEIDAVGRLIGKYGSHAMDLADACIVRMAEQHRDCLVLTVDQQFREVYRRNGRQTIPTVLPVTRKRSRS